MNTLIRILSLASALTLPILAQQAPVEAEVKPIPGKLVRAADVDAGKVPGQGVARQALAGKELKGGQDGLKATGGNSWFDVTVRELGTYYGTGEAIGVFTFENPHDQSIEWRGMQPSCQCAKAEIRVEDRLYRVMNKPKRIVRVTKRPGQPDKLENVKSITIGPKEKGEVETHLNMANITGMKSATLDIHSTDAVEPHTKLTFRAKGAQLFAISPKEVNLNKMTWNETREFSVTVSSSTMRDWKILNMEGGGPAFDVKWEKVQNGNLTSYKINGKYGPVNGETTGGGVLKFRTNVNGAATFNVRVLAFVQGPLEVKPGGFLTLGLIRKGKPIKKGITFEPNDGVDLQATSLEFEKMTLAKEFITATSRKEGNKLIVELSVADNAPSGLVKGDLVVKLNHPLVKEKRIMFNGFVR